MEDAEKNKPGGSHTITAHFIKSNSFRTIYVDGAHGGISPRGKLNMSVFSERMPIPKEESFEVQDVSQPRMIERVGKSGIIREVEATLIMDYPTMIAIRDWISEKISDFEKRYKIEQYSADKDSE